MRGILLHSFVLGSLLAVTLNAAPVYEGFNYSPGSSLSGQNGGSGWGGAWDSGSTILGVTTSTGLAFPGVATTPGAATADPAAVGSVAFFARGLGSSIGADNTTAYLSFLLRPEAGFGFYGGLNLGVFVGKSGITNTYGIEGVTDDISSSSVAAVAGTTVFLVLRMDFLPGNDVFSLYVNPTPGLLEPGVANAVKTNFDAGTIDTLFLNNGGAWTTDEIRVGDSFGAVTSVPEPTSGLGVAVGLLLLSVSARRRRTPST